MGGGDVLEFADDDDDEVEVSLRSQHEHEALDSVMISSTPQFDFAGVKTFINTCKCFVGASAFELPWAMSKGGLVGGTAGLVCLAILSNFSLLLINKSANIYGKANCTYPDLGERCFGTAGKIAVWFGIVSTYIGAGGSYCVFISKAMSDITITYNPAFTRQFWLIVIILPVMVLLSFIRDYRYQ